MEKQAVLIVNTKSRRGKEWYRSAKACLLRHGVNLVESYELRHPARLPEVTKKAVESGVPLVIVGGGDGTLSAVARYFVKSKTVMGVLPLGTGNQFARDLGIAADVESACETIAKGKVAEVDLGVAGDDYFLNVATVGLTTLIAEELTNEAKRSLGRLVYLVALSRALRRVRPFKATLTTPEGTHTFETLQIVIGNGRYHAGPFPLAPDATITDGKLTVYALAGTSRWELFRLALNLPGGHQVTLPDVPVYSVSGGSLKTEPIQRVTVDGEIVFKTPIAFGIAPAALRVMVPQSFQE